jgi:hypothetical protein
MSDLNNKPTAKLNRSGINRIIQITVFYLIYAAILFGCAGRLDWWEAWAYLGISMLGVIANGT